MGINLKKLDYKKLGIYGIATIYLLMPIDIIADIIPVAGVVDDLIAMFIARYYAEKK